ncbi:MAG: class I SAM-dependent rRNA methyltransferase [Pseudomonadota bacterium]
MLKVRLNRDLRKTILQGHPWVYGEAIEKPKKVGEACLCQVLDKKGKPLAWAIYSPKSTLALRIISIEKKPPNAAYFAKQIEKTHAWKKSHFTEDTNCYRLINGEGDGLPGFVCDIYGSLAVMQFDGDDCREFWDQEFLAESLLGLPGIETVYLKPRGSDQFSGKLWGKEQDLQKVAVNENGVRFQVNVVDGQKTGFFLDQRDNRQYVKNMAKGKSLLNLFSYSGGFSVCAGAGGATQVTSVDIAPEAILMASENWKMNELNPSQHKGESADVFKWIENQSEKWDMVVVDPPSMTHSEKSKNQAIETYTDLFAKSINLVSPGGDLFLSSCSSHISFDDFQEIIVEACSRKRKRAKIIRISGQGPDHPFPHAAPELRYLKFTHLRIEEN